MEAFAFGLTYALPAIAAAFAAGMVATATMKAAGRNPEKIKDLQTLMILGISFIDALAIIAFVAAIVGKVL